MVDPRPEVASMTLYSPGMPLSQARADSGRQELLKLASNESLWGPSPKSVAAASNVLAQLNYYPVVREPELLEAIGRRHGLESSQILVGNGADEVLRLIAQAYVRSGDEVVFPSPSFSAYRHSTLLTGGTPVPVALDANGANDLEGILAAVTNRTRLIYLCSPNNPTGAAFSASAWEDFWSRVPSHVLVVVDAAYHEFCQNTQPDIAAQIRNGRPVVWVRTFSKLFALASLRVGWAAGPASVIASLWKVRDAFSVNAVAWAAARGALEDTEYFERVVAETIAARTYFMNQLTEAGIAYYPSDANFVTVRIFGDDDEFSRSMLGSGYVVRLTKVFGLAGYARITVPPMPYIDELVETIKNLSRS